VYSHLTPRFLIVWLMILHSVSSWAASENKITVLAADAHETGIIDVRSFENIEYFSLTQWAENVDASLDWDYVTGIAEMVIRDHRLRWVDTGRGTWINGRMHSMPGPARQVDGDIWIPIKLLDDLVDPLWEGDLAWDASKKLLRKLVARVRVTGKNDNNENDQFVIVLDAGHGGSDQGCLNINGQREKDVVLTIVNRLTEILSDRLGPQVILTRPGDYLISYDDRVSEANRSGGDLFISFHIAPAKEMSNKSFMMNILPENVVDEHGSQLVLWEERREDIVVLSRSYAEKFGSVVATSASQTGFGLQVRDLRGLKGLSMPSFLIELSWESSFYGDIGIDTDGGCKRAAEAMFDGIREILKQEKTNAK